MPHTLLRRLPLLATLLLSVPAQAKIIQILHTNDLHASLETSGAPKPGDPETGNWARIKYLMDQLTADAKAKGIDTIRLDAGDFFEGTLDYFPDYGKSVLQAFQHMNYDAVTVGNHDWLMGAEGMNEAFGRSPFPFPVLSANIQISSRLGHLKQQISPTAHIIRDDVNFGIMGLSTHEALYSWIPKIDSYKNDFKIKRYEDEEDNIYGELPGIANKTIQKLRGDSDVVIALTHIGYGEDQDLAAASHGLDLIIGGHSHTFLDQLAFVNDLDGREIPIVQTGVNGKYVGKILIEKNPGTPAKVLFYELVPVPIDGPKDAVVDGYVQDALRKVEDLYTPAKLDEVVGQAEVRLVSGDSGPTAYSKFVVDAMKSVTNADLALDIGAFHGNTPQPKGQVTMRNLMQMYPRKFEEDQNEGLYVYRAKIPGWVLKLGIQYAVKWGYFLSFSGLTFDVVKLTDGKYDRIKSKLDLADQSYLSQYRARNIQINGQPVCLFCNYDVAAPESLIRGAYGISPLLHLVIHDGHATEHTIWDASRQYLQQIGTIHRISPDEHFSAKEFSPGYQKRYHTEPIHEQFGEGEGYEVPWHLHLVNFELGLNQFLKDIEKGLKNPASIQDEADEDR